MQGPTLISIFILLFIMFLTSNNVILKPGVKKAFVSAAITIGLIVIGDQVAEMVAGTTGIAGFFVSYLGNTVSKIFSPIAPIVFNYFSENHVFRKRKRLLIPIIIYEVLCFINLRYPIIFGIDPANNTYFRGPLIPVVTLISAYSFVIFLYGQVRRQYDLDKYDLSYLGIVYSMMLFGTVVQMLFPTIMILWCCVSLATLMYFMFVQEIDYKTDSVTGMKNRNVFKLRMHQLRKEQNVVLISFDLNDLKKINDTNGHAAGDDYLKASAKTIQKLFRSLGKLYRIGGDEFCLLSVNANKEQLQKKIGEISQIKKVYAEFGDFNFSLAYGVAERQLNEGLEECLKRADKEMYDNKAKQKSTRFIKYYDAARVKKSEAGAGCSA